MLVSDFGVGLVTSLKKIEIWYNVFEEGRFSRKVVLRLLRPKVLVLRVFLAWSLFMESLGKPVLR